jgi:hypothetical protein
MAAGADFRVEHNLNKTLSVPQIDKDHPAVIPATVSPAHQGDLRAGVRGVQVSAVMGPFLKRQKVGQSDLPRYLYDGFFKIVETDLFLRAGAHVPEKSPIFPDLSLTEFKGIVAVQPVCAFDLPLETPTMIIHFHPDSLHS